jgi:hypothetical protein
MFRHDNRRWKQYMETFFIIYILLQPFLDLLAFVGTEVSLVFRVAAMGVGFIYLLLHPKNTFQKVSVIYLLLLGFFMLINLLNNYMLKDPYYLVKEFTYSVKTVYVIEMLLVYTALFLSIRNRLDWEKNIQRNIFINMVLIGIVMFLSDITDTGKRSYDTLVKEGHSGWFYSANDLSAIFALGFTVAILYLLLAKPSAVKLLLLPFIWLVGWGMLTVGTKVGLGALLIILSMAISFSLFLAIVKKGPWLNVILIGITLIIAIFYIPSSPIGNNMSLTFFYQSDDSPDEGKEEKKYQLNTENLKYKMLSGRELFLANTKEDYQNAPLSQKLLGMGLGGNYEDNLKIIEMDFLDWWYGYGMIGFLILILPLLYFTLIILKSIFVTRFRNVNINFFMLGVGVTLGFGISFFAGHILLNPASGIYFSILLAYLYTLSIKEAVVE